MLQPTSLRIFDKSGFAALTLPSARGKKTKESLGSFLGSFYGPLQSKGLTWVRSRFVFLALSNLKDLSGLF